MTILFSFASRSRPKKFFAVLDNIRYFTEDKDYFVVSKLDNDDKSMQVVAHKFNEYPEMVVKWGMSENKVHAINRDLDVTRHWDILINISDDQLFLMKGFDTIIKRYFKQHGLDKFLHFKDSFAAERVATMSIIGRTYYERDKRIYNPCYFSMFCDEEETRKAKIRGCYVLCHEVIFDHWHYSQADHKRRIIKDALYIRNDTYREDQKVFIEREKINFGL